MENASKALIIAGAILLSILIIGLGVFIFNQANNSMKNINMNEQEVAAFNSKFEAYVGNNVTGSNVMALCDTVRTHNNANQDDFTRQVAIKNDVASATSAPAAAVTNVATVKADVKSGKTYKVNVTYDKNSGLVCEVGFKANT